jgi:hypothetical protein
LRPTMLPALSPFVASTAHLTQAQRSWSRRDMTLSPRCARSHRKVIGTLTHRYGGGSRCNRLNRQHLVLTRAGTDTRVQDELSGLLVFIGEALPHGNRPMQQRVARNLLIALHLQTYSARCISYGISLLQAAHFAPTPPVCVSKFGC